MTTVVDVTPNLNNHVLASVRRAEPDARIWSVLCMELLDNSVKIVILRTDGEDFQKPPGGLYRHLWEMLGLVTGQEILSSLKKKEYQVVSFREAVANQERWALKRAVSDPVWTLFKQVDGCDYLVENGERYREALKGQGWNEIGHCFTHQLDRALLDTNTTTRVLSSEEALGLVQPS